MTNASTDDGAGTPDAAPDAAVAPDAAAAPAWRPELDSQQRAALTVLMCMQRQSWEQGVASQAVLDLGRTEAAHAMAVDAATRQTGDGRLGELGHNIVNSGALGEVVLRAARLHRDPWLAQAFDRQIAWLCRGAPRARDGTLFHVEGLPEMWADTLYMVVPVLVLAGRTGEAGRQLAGHRWRLFDEGSGLYGSRWNENEQSASHPEHWGTGSGWVVAAIARALRLGRERDPAFPASDFAREAAPHCRTVIDACLGAADAVGGFRNILDDPASFAEGNVRQMLAYAMLLGVADGWLPESYAARGRALVAAAREHVDENGFVRHVCGSPHFDRQGVSAEAQSFFLLATDAEKRLEAVHTNSRSNADTL